MDSQSLDGLLFFVSRGKWGRVQKEGLFLDLASSGGGDGLFLSRGLIADFLVTIQRHYLAKKKPLAATILTQGEATEAKTP